MSNRELQELRATEIAQGELWEEKRVEHMWFHLMRGLVLKGEIARMGAVPFCVYCTVKAHTHMDSGDSYPTVNTIAELVGVSHDTVTRAMKTLQQLGYIAVRKVNRRNVYALTEKVDILTQAGDLYATAQRKYAAMQFMPFIDELKRFAKEGNLPNDKAITINLHVTVNNNTINGDHNQMNIGDITKIEISGSNNQVFNGDGLAKLVHDRLKNIE